MSDEQRSPSMLARERDALGLPPVTDEEQRKVDEALREHRKQKEAAFTAYLRDLMHELDVVVSNESHHHFAYVEHSLYGDEMPEGRLMVDALSRLSESSAAFFNRAAGVQQFAFEWAAEPEDEPSPRIYWDRIRNQKAGTHQAALRLLADTIVLVFNCDQYASARYLWRDREVR